LRVRAGAALALLIPLLVLFGPVLVTPRSFVFRDAAHFYHPLLEYVTSQWRSGQVPLWNPLEETGRPLLADATSAACYPGLLVFWLPLGFSTCYKLYVVGHVGLAAGIAYWVARSWRASVPAAGLCGMAYALAGHVVFQYANVVYLVGAAWLPLALGASARMLARRSFGWAAVLGVALALMVLGGDPQGAYHAGLLSALGAWLRWRRQCRLVPPAAPVARRSGHRRAVPALCGTDTLRQHPVALLAVAAITGGGLAAVQIVPAVRWARAGDRAAFTHPRCLVELVTRHLRSDAGENRPEQGRQGLNAETTTARSSAWTGLFGRPRPGTHDEQIYQFSLSPWRLPEFLWPNVSGRLFPVHQRWLYAIPAEGGTWAPSLYMGLLPVLLGLASIRLRRGPVRVRWLSWTVLLGLTGSLGGYGVGWLAAELRAAWGSDPSAGAPWGPAVGGLYWLMVVVLPGYVQFRYPAKLVVPAVLALSLLAARGWDRLARRPWPCLSRALAVLAVASLALAVLVLAARPLWERALGDLPADPLFGPLNVPGAAQDVWGALLHTTVVAGGLWILVRRMPGHADRWPAQVALLLTAIELARAQVWMVPHAPQSLWTETSTMARIVQRRADQDRLAAGPRCYRRGDDRWVPGAWADAGARARQVDGLAWDRRSLLPRYHLLDRLAVVTTSAAFTSADYHALHSALRQEGGGGVYADSPHRRLLDALGAELLVLPGGPAVPADARLLARVRPLAELPDTIAVWRNKRAFPRVWVVHDVQRLPPLRSTDPGAMAARTREVYVPDGKPRNLRREAVVETTDAVPVGQRQGPLTDDRQVASCRIVRDEPTCVEIDVELPRPGLLVLSDLCYAGWRAQLIEPTTGRTEPLAAWRTNRTMRGVWLEAGRHRVRWDYRPGDVYLGAAISLTVAGGLLIWTGWLVSTGWLAWRRRRSAAPRGPLIVP